MIDPSYSDPNPSQPTFHKPHPSLCGTPLPFHAAIPLRGLSEERSTRPYQTSMQLTNVNRNIVA